MKKAKFSLLAGTVLAGGMLVSNTAIALDRGEMLANTCAGCHGPNGVSHGPATPSIAGISKDYFIESMHAYASGDRPSTIMMRIAKGYSDADIEAMANYFSKQKHHSAKQETNDKMASKGAKIHKKYCEKCHSEGGSLAEDDAGILAGQWKPYLQYNLHDFTSGNREAPKKMAKQLKSMHEKYGQDGIDELIEFYSSK
ncbi:MULTISPECIES: c-type cytochrome [Thiomicrorhabdus]|uniref:Cytochrome c4 n=1 Tax=Thiomicrorhabdus heinhorstiae TaxID=2748010 RepID=A0ABS0BWM6_9GAMM|nr:MULTISPECIES: c-type cytochrome [Thiomicrorhabdus]MBF6058213.1 cytochrome c4 [Thiomicrorhabdus heinhorstiae]